MTRRLKRERVAHRMGGLDLGQRRRVLRALDDCPFGRPSESGRGVGLRSFKGRKGGWRWLGWTRKLGSPHMLKCAPPAGAPQQQSLLRLGPASFSPALGLASGLNLGLALGRPRRLALDRRRGEALIGSRGWARGRGRGRAGAEQCVQYLHLFLHLFSGVWNFFSVDRRRRERRGGRRNQACTEACMQQETGVKNRLCRFKERRGHQS